MAHTIEIKECIPDDYSWYNIKRFKIGNNRIERPLKVLDIKNMTLRDYTNCVKNTHDFDFYEFSKTITSYDSITNVMNYDDDGTINDYFGRKSWLDNKNQLVNFTFNFNPYDFIGNIEEEMGSFYDYYYQYSSPLLFVPNIRKNKTMGNTKADIISVEQYIDFVDQSYEYLDHKNKKVIFVPISLKFNVKDMKSLAQHYMDKDNRKYYFWIDFEGKAITKANMGKIRCFYREIERIDNRDKEKEVFNNTIFYHTNINRETMSNSKMEEAPASDILSSTAGATFIGVNRKPMSNFDPPQGYQQDYKHKYRLFDKDTYYYDYNSSGLFFSKGLNNGHNAIELDKEFASQSEHFLDELQIKSYLSEKKMIEEKNCISVIKR